MLLPSRWALPSVWDPFSASLVLQVSPQPQPLNPKGGGAVVVAVSPGRRAGLSPPLRWEVGGPEAHLSAAEEALAIEGPALGKNFLGRGLPANHTTGVTGGLFLLTGSLSPGWPTLYGGAGCSETSWFDS